MFQDRFGWYLRVSAYWFATSFKWFLALLLLPAKVNTIIPAGQQNSVWGMILAIGAAEATIGPAVMGWLSDRTSTRFGRRRPWILAGAMGTTLACYVLGSAGTVPMLIIGYLILQISDDIGTGPYSALIPEFVPSENRGRASGALGMLNFSAQICAAVLAFGGTIAGLSHGLMFGLIAGLHLLCAWIVWGAVQESSYPPVHARPFSIEIWISPWRNANFRWVWASRFLIAFGFYILTAFGQNYLKDVVQVFTPLPSLSSDPVQSALLAAIVVIVLISTSGVVGALVGGRLADRVGRKRVIQVSGVIMFLAILPFAFLPIYIAILCLALVFGLGYGAFSSADWALVSDILPSEADFAKDMGIWQSSVALPQVFNGLMGASIDVVNRQSQNIGYTMAFVISAVSLLAGSILVRFVRLKQSGGVAKPTGVQP